MEDEASYVCDSCGEETVMPIDLSGGTEQTQFEDCPVCCSPSVIHVQVDPDGEVCVWAEAEPSDHGDLANKGGCEMTELISTSEYRDWIASIKGRVQASQIKAAVAVNRELLELYWFLGEQIIDRQQSASWGEVS